MDGILMGMGTSADGNGNFRCPVRQKYLFFFCTAHIAMNID